MKDQYSLSTEISFCRSRKKSIFAEKYHKTVKQILLRSQEDIFRVNQKNIADSLYSYLLCLFADVFCFFAANFADFRFIVHCLRFWLEKNMSFILSEITNSQLIIVTETTTSKKNVKKKTKRLFLSIFKDKTTKNIFSLFSAVNVLCALSENHVSVKTQLWLLKKYLLNASDHIQINRLDINYFFSARHFTAFFNLTCDHFATTFKKSFNFIKTFISQYSVLSDLNTHLFNFLMKIKSLYDLMKFTVLMMTSSFLLNDYSSNMHDKLYFVSVRT